MARVESVQPTNRHVVCTPVNESKMRLASG